MDTMNQNLFNALKRVSETTACRFASITYKAKESGEVSRHTLLLGVDVGATYRRDLAIFKAKLPNTKGVETVACGELIDSLTESLTVGIGNNSAYTCKGVYEPVAPGIKTHKETGDVYINGFSLRKKVLIPGTYKTVKSAEKTIAKNGLRKLGKLSRFRQFIIKPENVRKVKLVGRVFAVKAT